MANLKGASLSSSTVNLVKTIMGCGILCVPYIFAQTGLVLGMVVLLLCGAASILALHLLALCALQAQSRGQDASFRSLSQIAFGGKPSANALVSACVMCVTYGSAVGYFIVIGDLVPEVAEYLGVHNKLWTSRHFWITALGWGIELPLCFLSNLESLKVSSVVGMFGIMYIVIVVALFALGVIPVPVPEQKVTTWPPPASAHTSAPGMLTAIPMFVFAFGCAKTVPTLVVELQDNTPRRVDIMIVAAVSICAAIFAVVGVCGSLAFGASIEGNALKSFPNEEGSVGGLISVFARIAIVVNVMGTIPLSMHPLRALVAQMLFGKDPPELPFQARTALTIGLFVLTWSLALAVDSLDTVLAFLGATSDTMIGFTLPALFYCLSVKSQRDAAATEDSLGQFGVTLQSQEAGGVTDQATKVAPLGLLRRAAWVMAAVSAALIPVLTAGEVYKLFNEN
jgi:amino acid permease